MPVPEIDRLAHEILDILGDDPSYWKRPDSTGTVLDRALVTITRESRKINAANKPLYCRLAERLQPSDFGLEDGSPVWNDSSSKFKACPTYAFLGLYAALERAEMQERALTTTHLATNDPALLPLAGNPSDDVNRHQEEQ